MAQQRIPDIVLKVQQMAKPSFINGRWRRGVLSARRMADVRKSLVAEGIYWPPKPLRDRGADKPLKLNKHERTRVERYEDVGSKCYYISYKYCNKIILIAIL